PGGAAAAAGVDAALPGVLAAAHRGTEGFSHGDGPMTEAAVEDDLMVECELDAAPGKVWRALTVPDFLTAWLLPGAGATLLDDALTLDGSRHGLSARIACTVLEAEPERRLRMSWEEADATTTVVTFELQPTVRGGTALRVRHGPARMAPRAANSNSRPLALAA